MSISRATISTAIKAIEKEMKEYAWGKKMYDYGYRSAYDINCAKHFDGLLKAITELKGKIKNAKEA